LRWISFVFLAPDGRVRPAWRALVFVLGYGALVAVGFVGVISVFGEKWLGAYAELALFANGVIGLAAGCLASWIFLRAFDRRSFRTLGLWSYAGWGRELWLGLLAGAGLLALVLAPLALAGRLEFTGVKLELPHALRALGWALLLFIPNAANEDVLFRGYPFQRLVEAWGQVVPVLGLSVLFGLAHLTNPAHTWIATVNTAIVGIFLALLYLKTRGLWLPIGFHFSWNFLMGFGCALPVSGLVLRQQPWSVAIGGPVWLTGGNYGPEGSVLTTGVFAVATLWLWRTRRLGVSPVLAKELE
jgi:hypothetical protein